MAMAANQRVIDTFLYFPPPQPTGAVHLFGAAPRPPEGRETLSWVLEEMDRHRVDRAMLEIDDGDGLARRALKQHPQRFIASVAIDPNEGMKGVRRIVEAVAEHDVRAVTAGPAFCNPPVPIDDKRFYPIYAKCAELSVPIFLTTGIPGPRVPMAPQHVERLDEVCWFFPELTLVMRHGAMPWDDLAVSLMKKWPNLYFSTSGFAPRRYSPRILEYAAGSGGDKILFAGYFALGLTYERIFAELAAIDLPDAVWPAFMADNAARILKLR